MNVLHFVLRRTAGRIRYSTVEPREAKVHRLTRRRDDTEGMEQWSIWEADVRVEILRHVGATQGRMIWQWGCWGGETGSAISKMAVEFIAKSNRD